MRNVKTSAATCRTFRWQRDRSSRQFAFSTNLQDAANGFKNLGQFVAAEHVSHNLGIPFADLKKAMMGLPAKSHEQAIHELETVESGAGAALVRN